MGTDGVSLASPSQGTSPPRATRTPVAGYTGSPTVPRECATAGQSAARLLQQGRSLSAGYWPCIHEAQGEYELLYHYRS